MYSILHRRILLSGVVGLSVVIFSYSLVESKVENKVQGDDELLVTVDYGRSLKDSLLAGHYDVVNKHITEINFPYNKDGKGKEKVVLELFKPDLPDHGCCIKSEEVLQMIDEKGCRSATYEELLAYGEAHRRLKPKSSIVALGSIWVNRHGGKYVIGLGSDPGVNGVKSNYDQRYLDILGFKCMWDADCRFLVVKK